MIHFVWLHCYWSEKKWVFVSKKFLLSIVQLHCLSYFPKVCSFCKVFLLQVPAFSITQSKRFCNKVLQNCMKISAVSCKSSRSKVTVDFLIELICSLMLVVTFFSKCFSNSEKASWQIIINFPGSTSADSSENNVHSYLSLSKALVFLRTVLDRIVLWKSLYQSSWQFANPVHKAVGQLASGSNLLNLMEQELEAVSRCIQRDSKWLAFKKLGPVEPSILSFSCSHCRRGRGCCATTRVRKVDIEFEFNFLPGSGFLSRLVRQVISVPFVV